MTTNNSLYCLPDSPDVPSTILEAVREDYDRLAKFDSAIRLDDYLAERYHLDLTTHYAGIKLSNPWGKASGQLSMTSRQVAEDVEAGLGFIVLKTLIAQDASGIQTMRDWAIKESRMDAEPIVGQSGERGWTISWKGRGWWQSFDDYLDLVRDARRISQGSDTLIVPSCKFHLPTPEESGWKVSEYEYTVGRLVEAWRESDNQSTTAMPIEKDFSPTLAGSGRAATQSKILEWLQTVPKLIREAVPNSSGAESGIRIGLKIFNALFDDDFQLDMLNAIHQAGPDRPDFLIYGNRLFDPNREFDGHRGIAFGGPDLSDRNLRVMSKFLELTRQANHSESLLPWSATGNITSGRMALEYALRGASSFQLHTYCQLPGSEYRMRSGSKIQKALHELYFHPQNGFIVWMYHLAGVLDLPTHPLRFTDVIGRLADLRD